MSFTENKRLSTLVKISRYKLGGPEITLVMGKELVDNRISFLQN